MVKKRVLSDKSIYDIYILIGNYASKEQAEAVASDLSHLKRLSFTPVRFRGKNLFRIRLGAIETQEKAETLLGRILSRGYNTAKIKRYKRLKIKL
jgi:hypothetical protein